MASPEVMRQFLISLRFQVDEAGLGKFVGEINSITKSAKGAGLAVVAVAAAAQTMVATFASQMEKMYYASKRTGSSVENLMALESGSRKIGLAAGQAQGALEAMSGAVRMNPGLRGLMNMLTGQNTGRMDQSKAMLEVVKKLSEMPHHVGARFAQMFGIDEQTFTMLKQGLPELVKAEEAHVALLRQAGVDGQAAADASKEYMNGLRDLGDKVTILGQKIALNLLPYFRDLTKETNRSLDAMLTLKASDFSWTNVKGAAGEMWKDIKEKIVGPQSDALGKTILPNSTQTKPGNSQPSTAPVATSKAVTNAASLFAQLEKQYQLPAGLLDNMWRKESSRGRYMLSPAGAKGHFGFMDATAKQYGVKDPNNLIDAATGAAKYMSHLKDRYQGDVRKALAAYNWGPGNFEKKGGLGNLPRETRDYVNDIGKSITINQKTDIHVNGTGDPKAVAANVMDGQARLYGDLTRNTLARVQ